MFIKFLKIIDQTILFLVLALNLGINTLVILKVNPIFDNLNYN